MNIYSKAGWEFKCILPSLTKTRMVRKIPNKLLEDCVKIYMTSWGHRSCSQIAGHHAIHLFTWNVKKKQKTILFYKTNVKLAKLEQRAKLVSDIIFQFQNFNCISCKQCFIKFWTVVTFALKSFWDSGLFCNNLQRWVKYRHQK